MLTCSVLLLLLSLGFWVLILGLCVEFGFVGGACELFCWVCGLFVLWLTLGVLDASIWKLWV